MPGTEAAALIDVHGLALADETAALAATALSALGQLARAADALAELNVHIVDDHAAAPARVEEEVEAVIVTAREDWERAYSG